MKKSIVFYAIVALVSLGFTNNSFARDDFNFPPDSTSNIFEKGTAQYFIAEGKRLYNEGQFRVALLKFREALVKDKGNPMATYWVGECHRILGNYQKAINYAEEAIAKDPEVDKEYGYLLGICYQRLADLDKAIEMFDKCRSMVKDQRAKELKLDFLIAECERGKEMMNNPVKVSISNLGLNINSAFDDYSPTLSPDGKTLYFTSRRADNKGGGVNPDDQRYFEDIYISTWDESNNEWSEAKNDDERVVRVNTKGFDAVCWISPDEKYLYVSINTMAMDKPKPKTKHTDIFVCRKNNRGGWNTPKPVGKPINTIWWDALPSLNADQTAMYFISERKGGEGRGDIWVSRKEGKAWGKPVNLGKEINTKGQETTVCVTPDEKYLFFSSDGHEGMGGYDVYVSMNVEGQWSKPVNLGYPINTVSDETHFTYYPEMKKAYYSTFSSSDNKGIGARDIFEVDMSEYEFKSPE